MYVYLGSTKWCRYVAVPLSLSGSACGQLLQKSILPQPSAIAVATSAGRAEPFSAEGPDFDPDTDRAATERTLADGRARRRKRRRRIRERRSAGRSSSPAAAAAPELQRAGAACLLFQLVAASAGAVHNRSAKRKVMPGGAKRSVAEATGPAARARLANSIDPRTATAALVPPVRRPSPAS